MLPKPHLPYIDALRGWAILGVVFCHTFDLLSFQEIPGGLKQVFKNMSHGVEVFFFVSAFTLYLSLESENDIPASGFKAYSIRRFFRIAPLFYLACLFSWLFLTDFYHLHYDLPFHISNWNVLSHLTFTFWAYPPWMNSFVFGGWTIATEVHFYLLLPFLFVRVKTINQAIYLFYIALIVRLLFRWLFHPFDVDRMYHQYQYQLIFNQFPVFCLGIVGFLWVIKKQVPSVKTFIPLAFMFLFDKLIQQDVFIPEHIQFALLTFLLVFLLHHGYLKFAQSSPMVFLGKLSYSVYFVHPFILHGIQVWEIQKFFPSGNSVRSGLELLVWSVLVLVSSMAISYPIYLWIEEPFRKLGKQWIVKLGL
ncbi:MAG: acyltransferase [Bacteroidia bacterium]|nr:acyltransferase [Bacteroidia bacterium]